MTAVKYYQREGLLPEGARSAPNQVSYDDTHVQRVRLVRAMLETGGLSIAATKEVIRVLDDRSMPIAGAFAVAQHAMSSPRTQESAPSAAARARVASIAEAQGWSVGDDNPGLALAARALDGLVAIGFDAPEAYLTAYAQAAARAAEADLEALAHLDDDDSIAELMVVGTVLGDPLFAGLRRLAQQDASARVFPADAERSVR